MISPLMPCHTPWKQGSYFLPVPQWLLSSDTRAVTMVSLSGMKPFLSMRGESVKQAHVLLVSRLIFEGIFIL